jgi:rhodanese-related sulfurtransferase
VIVLRTPDKEIGAVFCLAKDAPQLAGSLPPYVRSVQVAPDSVGFYHVPAIAMVDHEGVISALWTGYVEDTHVSSALDSLFGGAPNRTSGFKSTSESELHERRGKGEPFQIVDPRTHEVAVQGGPVYVGGVQAVNIPAGEISMRARYELNRDTPVIVDCRSIKGLSCQDVIATLAAQGFRDLAGLGLKRMGSSPICAASAQSPKL